MMQLEHDLRSAIAHGELQVHYQPIVSLAAHEVTSLEALVRWQRPSGEMIAPDQFISLAEEMGVITTIDQYVLRQACQQLQTWSVFIKNAIEAAAMLKQLNVQICLDDFGTGYSSFSYLHQFPIGLVKIDRSFVQNIDTDPERLEIVRAIIGLCHTLGMAVTAEGIETPQQRDILRDLGCEYGQGYLFSRAIAGATITQSLQM